MEVAEAAKGLTGHDRGDMIEVVGNLNVVIVMEIIEMMMAKGITTIGGVIVASIVVVLVMMEVAVMVAEETVTGVHIMIGIEEEIEAVVAAAAVRQKITTLTTTHIITIGVAEMIGAPDLIK